MKPQPSDQQQAQAFDSYAKQTLKGAARNHYKKSKRLREREVSFSELTSTELAGLAVTDKYFADENSFEVLNWKIGVDNDALAEALNELPTGLRDIVLLYFFLDMTDKEIAECLKVANSTISYQRKSSIKKLRKIMEGSNDEQN